VPSTRGGKNWQHASFNPQAGLLYAATFHEGRMYQHLEVKPHVVGQRYMYIENLLIPRAAGSPIGHIDAIDPLTGEKKWRVPLTDLQIWSAMLSTGGGLLSPEGDRRVHRAGRRHRHAAVAIPDRLRHQRPTGDLYA